MQFGGIPLLLALLLPAQAEDPAPPPPAPAQEGTGKAAPARPKAPDGPAAAEARGDRIHLLDGRIITGEVVDEGTQIRVIKRLGSVLILKRDVIKVEIEDEVVVVHPTLDRVILHSGQEIIGKVRIEKDGELVVVVGELGEISHPRSEVYDIILANPEAKGRVRDRGAVQKRIAAQIASLDDEEKAEEARNGIIAEGIFAIAQLEAALPDATGRRREEIERILRTNRLRTVLTREIEIGVPAVYERLLGPEPGARLEALQEIVLYHKDDAGRILAHMMGEGEADPVIRGYIVDQMGKLRRTTDLMDLLQTADPQVQLASAIALGENGILLGVPVLIRALGVEDESVRTTAFEKLNQFTSEDFLYWPKDPEGDPADPTIAAQIERAHAARAEAIARWQTWWEAERENLVRLSMKEFDKANVTEKDRSEAAKFYDEGSEILDAIARGDAEVKEESLHQGIFLLRSAVEKDPTLGKARLHLAILHYLRRERADLEEAEEQLRAIVERYPTESGKDVLKLAHYYLGRLDEERSDWDAARLHYEASIRTDPKFVDGHYSLGKALFTRAIFEEGLDVEIKRRLLDSASRRFEEAVVAVQTGYDELQEAYRGFSLIQGDTPYRGGAFRTRLREYNAVLRAKAADIHYWNGRALLALGDFPEALSELDKAARMAPEKARYKDAADGVRGLLATPEDKP